MIQLIHPDKNKEDRANSATQSEAVMRSKQGELSKIKPGREAGYPAVDATRNSPQRFVRRRLLQIRKRLTLRVTVRCP